MVSSGNHRFGMECKSSGSLSRIAMAVNNLSDAAKHSPEPVIPLLVVPYMGETARAYCEQRGVGWLDLCGNGMIVAPGLFYQAIGNPSRFAKPGRPESAFGPKGSRVARCLLTNPAAPVFQRALAHETGLNEGHLSRLVGKLVDLGLAHRTDGGISVPDGDLLLDASRAEYRFNRHTIIRGDMAGGSGDTLARSLSQSLETLDVPYAATGLAAAWLWTKYAGFRLATVYLADFPTDGLKTALGFREEPRGANTWLVVPNDEGVFHGASEVEGIRCVHPVQVYLDLNGHPERAQAAADELGARLRVGSLDGR